MLHGQRDINMFNLLIESNLFPLNVHYLLQFVLEISSDRVCNSKAMRRTHSAKSHWIFKMLYDVRVYVRVQELTGARGNVESCQEKNS